MSGKRPVGARLLALLLGAALLLSTAAVAAEPAPDAAVLGIYTTANMSGSFWSTDPLTGETGVCSYAGVAAAMAAEREETEAVLLLDGGNAVGTGLSAGDPQAAALALRTIGYDALIPGEQEFRLGREGREAFFQALTGQEDDASVSVLSANFLDGETLEPVLKPYQIYTVTLDKKPLRVAVVGLGGIDAARRLPAAYYEGFRFSHPDNLSASYAWEWTNCWQPALEAEECDLVVVVCGVSAGELEALAAATTGIDLLVGGGETAFSTQLQNGAGESVQCVGSGGSALTRTLVTRDRAGNVVVGDSSLLDLAGYEGDSAFVKTMSSYQGAALAAAAVPVGQLSGAWDDGTFALYRQTDAADLVGRALLWASGATAALIAPEELGELSLSSLFQAGADTAVVTARDCARLAPDDRTVVLVELTAGQLTGWLDRCAGLYQVEADGSVSGGTGADILYGLSYELYLGGAEGERVSTLSYLGLPVADGQVLQVAVDAARLSDPAFPECQVIWSSAADRQFAARGGTMAAILADYLRWETAQNGSVEPEHTGSWALYTGEYNGPLTRLEFVELLYAMAGSPRPGADVAFIDVTGSDAAVWAAETGVVSGNGWGSFLPNQTLTREQAAAMLYNYARFLGLSTPAQGPLITGLEDYAAISVWARPAVTFCLRAGVMPAVGAGSVSFHPQGTLTRTEAAEYLAAFRDYAGQ